MKDEIGEILAKSLSFWSAITQEQQALLVAHTTKMSYAPKCMLHAATRECIGVLLVEKGSLRTYLLSEDGKEVTLFRSFPGDVCVLSASCILQSISFEVCIEAIEETEVLVINASVFAALQQENVYVENFALQIAATRFSDVVGAMEQMLFVSLEARIATFLVEESRQRQSPNIDLTQEEIAKYIGSAREAVSRVLKKLEQEGCIQRYRGGVRIVDEKQLSKSR